jgi:peptidoglycan/xylan/chitin deacetylase (PgdA/CDA1 family)
MRFLHRAGFTSVAFDGGTPPGPGPRQVAITFDDGYLDNYSHALPILLRYCFTATIFLASRFVGTTARWPGAAGAEMLGWSHANEMSRLGIALQSHTCTHPDLTGCEDALLDRELRGSRQEIEDRVGRAVRSLAYPYGRFDGRVLRHAASAGYSSAFSAGLSSGLPLAQERIRILAGDGASIFALKVSGWASWLRRARHGGRLPAGARSGDGE